jgi:hypothetical protein
MGPDEVGPGVALAVALLLALAWEIAAAARRGEARRGLGGDPIR